MKRNIQSRFPDRLSMLSCRAFSGRVHVGPSFPLSAVHLLLSVGFRPSHAAILASALRRNVGHLEVMTDGCRQG